MVKKILKLLPLTLLMPTLVYAEGIIDLSQPVPKSVADLMLLVISAEGFVTAAAGAVAALMIVYSAFLYITAGGNDEKLQKAKTTLFWTITGIVLIVSAKVLVNLFLIIFGAKN